MGVKVKHQPQEQTLTEELAAKIASRIVVKGGGLHLVGNNGGKLAVMAQGDDGEPGPRGQKGIEGDKDQWRSALTCGASLISALIRLSREAMGEV